MMIKSNELIKYGDYIIRIVYVDYVDNITYVVDMDKNKWPYIIPLNNIQKDLEQCKAKKIEDSYLLNVAEGNLSNIEIEKRDNAWQVINSIISKQTGVNIFISKYRIKSIAEAVDEYKISYNSIKNYLLRYWKFGQTKMALTPSYYNCGGRGKEKQVGDKKRGRPGSIKGVNITEDIKKKFIAGLNKYYYNQRMNSLKTVYELIIRDYYVKEYIIEKGEKTPILKDRSEIPTYNQFLYWFGKLNDTKKEIIKRQGERKYHQRYRSIIGTSMQEVKDLGSNSLWQIDSTILDCYLVSSINKNQIISRPVLYFIIDVYSKMIMSAYVTLESFNSYSGAMMALIYGMTSKVDYCRKYGIEISEEDWPSAVPQYILADRGELVNGQIETAIENLGISIQNSPPYRADAKGIVEKAFDIINKRYKPFTDGVVVNGINKIDRGSIDYRLLANLSLEEMTKIILKCVIFHNNNHVLSDDISQHIIVDESIERIPLTLWKYGIENKNGVLRTLPDDVIKINLLPNVIAKVTAKGVLFRKLYYVSEYTLSNGWHSKARTKGNWEINISYNPIDMSEIYFVEEDRKTFHILKLVDYLEKFKDKCEYEIDNYFRQCKNVNEKAKGKELSKKIKLFNEIEEIVKSARESSEEQKDERLSKSKRLKGITENNRNERELHKEKLFNICNEVTETAVERENKIENKEHYSNENDLDLYKKISNENWGDANE